MKQVQEQVVITNVQPPPRPTNQVNQQVLSPMTHTTARTANDQSQDIDDVTTSTGSISTRTRAITMTQILNCIDNRDSEAIFQNKDLHYFSKTLCHQCYFKKEIEQ